MNQSRSREHGDTPALPELSGTLRVTAERLFFIVGCGRSGTSLLQVMISSHPEIAIPNETGFYSLIRQRYLKRWGEIGTSSTFRCAFEATMDFWRIRELELDENEVWRHCQGAEPSWDALFLAILATYADKRGKPRIGEKSPGHLNYLDLLSRRFPRARFIHIVRDPRAVFLSQMHTPFGTKFVGAHCKKWEKAVTVHRNCSETLGPDRYLLVKYEDLIRETESVIRSICHFLGVSYSETVLQHDKRGDFGFAQQQYGHMANTLKPIFTSSIDRWERALSEKQIALIEQRLRRDMELMGYTLSGAKTYFPGSQYRKDIVLNILERAGRKIGRLVRRKPAHPE
jgi:hypothetical protein